MTLTKERLTLINEVQRRANHRGYATLKEDRDIACTLNQRPTISTALDVAR
jgi:hypothetical protein